MESTGRQFIAVIDEWDAPIRDKSATDSLLHYIGMDYSGMSDAVRNLLAGKSVGVNIRMFQNDITEFQGLDDVLTLLIHFGYLSYNQENETARIPNEEIRMEFEDCIRHVTLPRDREAGTGERRAYPRDDCRERGGRRAAA